MKESKSNTSIEDELDDIIIEYLETLENYLRSALDEERLSKEGYINIAHARMCIKPSLITLDGYPSEVTKDMDASSRVIDGDATDKCDLPEKRIEIDSSKQLECRRIFGLNIPASLKSAQGSFHRVLERTVERVNIVRKLEYLGERKLKLEKELKDVEADKENVKSS